MAKFTVVIEDEGSLAGITAARENYNASLPPPRDIEGVDEVVSEPIKTDAEYVQFVMQRAAESYKQQYKV